MTGITEDMRGKKVGKCRKSLNPGRQKLQLADHLPGLVVILLPTLQAQPHPL